MQTRGLKVALLLLFYLCVLVSGVSVAHAGTGKDYKDSYYYQAYDQGFRSGRADHLAGRAYGYHAALVITVGLQAFSQDYRNAFRLGYQDGYASPKRQSDWFYKHHGHDNDCDADDGGKYNWGCREHHDNGKHKGWYKHHHEDGDRDDD